MSIVRQLVVIEVWKIRESRIFAQKEDLRARRFRKNDFGGTCVFSNEGFGSSNLGTRLFSCTEFFLPKELFFERMHIFLFPKKEGNNLTESAMPYYSDYV